MEPTTEPEQVYRVFIKASPERIWEAITRPELTSRYFYDTRVETDLEVGRPFVYLSSDRSRTTVDGEVLECDPPRRLAHTWRMLYDPAAANEQPSRVTWEIEQREDGVCLLTLVHDRLESSPVTAREVVGEGWMYVLSGLKTLLETGQPLTTS